MSRLFKAIVLLAAIVAGVIVSMVVWGGSSSPPSSGSSAAGQQGSNSSAQQECRRPMALIGTAVVNGVSARARPDPGSRVIATFPKVNEQGSPQVFLLNNERLGADGLTWFDALLPIRPNDTHGFIPREDLRLARTPYRLVVDRQDLRLTLLSRCREVATYPVALGTKETPTPVGNFYLASLVKPPTPTTVYGPYAYGLSGYSRVIRNWRWGGLIGLHGTNDPSTIGHRVSHGCIRLRNKDITSLVKRLPLGTPITIL